MAETCVVVHAQPIKIVNNEHTWERSDEPLCGKDAVGIITFNCHACGETNKFNICSDHGKEAIYVGFVCKFCGTLRED